MIENRASRLILTLFSLVFVISSPATAENQAPDMLTIDALFATEDFDGESAPDLKWVGDGAHYVVLEPLTGDEEGHELAIYNASTGLREVLVASPSFYPSGSDNPLDIESYTIDYEDNRLLLFANAERVWRRKTRGDYWLLNLDSGQLSQLGAAFPPSSLMFAKLSPNGALAAYVSDNNLVLEDVATGKTTRLTTDGSSTIINGTFDWVYEEELGLRDGFRWSPDGKRIAFWRLDSKDVPEYTIANYTDSNYPDVKRFGYPKVGQSNSTATVGVVEVETGETIWFELPGRPEFEYIARMAWAKNSTEVLVQQLDRRQQVNRVSLCEKTFGKCSEVLTERDSAWVETHDEPIWTKDGESFLWLSERDGHQHLYDISRDGSRTKLLTPGNYDVIDLIKVDTTANRAFFTASPDNPTQRYLYQVDLNGGGKVRRLSPAGLRGTHSYDVAPAAGLAIHTFSSLTEPPVISVVSLPDHQQLRLLIDNHDLRERLQQLKQPATEFFRVRIDQVIELDGWCLKPSSFDPSQRYPVLVYVYGEPAGQTVLDRWGRGSGPLWYWMLTQHGYVVLSVDNRGTPAPRGREWRKSVYGQIGILASEDQAAAINALAARWRWIDRERMAIWGWSGGGSMTLNMMLRYPGLFAAGMSVAPVADQRLYDTIYQERYMGLLDENLEGYIQGSPVTFAHQLEGKLLLVHGTGDDNVHSQNTEVMVNELIKHNKQFSMMLYPNRSHSIREGENTSRHLRQMLTDFLMTHVPPGPKPQHTPDP